MANPLLPLQFPWTRARPADARLRRVPVRVPNEGPANDAIFLVLRRMRLPMILLVSIFTIAVAGLTLIPGVDAAGAPRRMTPFESF